MKILIVGSSGREHAMAWKLRQSPHVTQLFCAPGNPGIASLAKIVPIRIDDLVAIEEFARSERIDLTVVGPELPLTLGIVDRFRAAGLPVFGPTQAAARLEGSKQYAKEVMVAAGVATAAHAVFQSREALLQHLASAPMPSVLKADGLAAGKGVFVCMTREDAVSATRSLFDELKASTIVVEEFMEGVEASFIVATDGRRIVPLATAHDYKRIFDNDKGPNTGGMGTVSPTPRLSVAQEASVVEEVIRPVLTQMEKQGTPFSGFLYAGLMITPKGQIKVVEFNARLGDPETQVIMRRMSSDLALLLLDLATAAGKAEARWSDSHAVCLVLAAENYPGEPRKGDEVSGIELAETMPGVAVFHAGTALNEQGKLVTAGGRVLNVTATGASAAEARSRAYRAADIIQFRARQMRRDIGAQ
jgi:phosphoribosylamine--glycine ligase